MDGRLEARGLRKARGGVGGLGVEPGPTAATGGRRAVERRPGLPTGDARGRAWSKVILLRSPSTQHTHDAAGRLLEVVNLTTSPKAPQGDAVSTLLKNGKKKSWLSRNSSSSTKVR